MIPEDQFPSGTIRSSSSLPICLDNKTDSGISSVGQSTPVKSKGINRQHLTSTPKSQLKLIQAVHQLSAKLSAKQQGAPHGAHVHQDHRGPTWKGGWGDELRGWQTSSNIHNASMDSSIVSIDDHTQLTTKTFDGER